MALPNNINKSVPAGTDLPSTLDNRIRELATAVEDIIGIPDQQNITTAMAVVTSNGLDSVIFADMSANALSAGRLRRNGTGLTWHDGTSASAFVTATGTVTLTNKTLTTPNITSPNISGGGVWIGSPILVSANLQTSTAGTPLVRDGVVNKQYVDTLAMGYPFDFRLTLTTALPVTTADVSGASATTIFVTPYKGNRVATHVSATQGWVVASANEFSAAVPASASQNYDAFVVNTAGTMSVEFTAWAGNTTRATALTLQDGVLVKSGDTTRRYAGSFRTVSSNQTADTSALRLLWNYYNRSERHLSVVDTANTWTYNSITIRQAGANTANQVQCVVGVDEDIAQANVQGYASNDTGNVSSAVGVGIDSTTVNSAQIFGGYQVAIASTTQLTAGQYRGFLGIGYHRINWLEWVTATGTTTFYGDNGATIVQSGMVVNFKA